MQSLAPWRRLWASTSIALLPLAHLLARAAGKCSLTAQGKEVVRGTLHVLRPSMSRLASPPGTLSCIHMGTHEFQTTTQKPGTGGQTHSHAPERSAKTKLCGLMCPDHQGSCLHTCTHILETHAQVPRNRPLKGVGARVCTCVHTGCVSPSQALTPPWPLCALAVRGFRVGGAAPFRPLHTVAQIVLCWNR